MRPVSRRYQLTRSVWVSLEGYGDGRWVYRAGAMDEQGSDECSDELGPFVNLDQILRYFGLLVNRLEYEAGNYDQEPGRWPVLARRDPITDAWVGDAFEWWPKDS